MAESIVLTVIALGLGVPVLLAGLIGRHEDGRLRCRRCGHELAGVEAMICPECGRSLARPRAVRHGRRRRRRAALAAGLMLVGVGAGALEYRRGGRLDTSERPSWRLLAEIAVFPHDDHARRIRQLESRWRNGEISRLEAEALTLLATRAWAEEPLRDDLRRPSLVRRADALGVLGPDRREVIIAAAIGALGGDEDRGNAKDALGVLAGLWPDSARALRTALRSPDHQRRQYAAYLLMEPDRLGPTPRLIEVAVEALADDRDPWTSRAYTGVWNASRARAFLTRHVRAAEEELLAGLESTDPQQRLYCAMILARNGSPDVFEPACRTLALHLRDNDVARDARRASQTLLACGPPAISILYAARADADAQARKYIDRIITRIAEADDSGE